MLKKVSLLVVLVLVLLAGAVIAAQPAEDGSVEYGSLLVTPLSNSGCTAWSGWTGTGNQWCIQGGCWTWSPPFRHPEWWGEDYGRSRECWYCFQGDCHFWIEWDYKTVKIHCGC